MSIGSHTLPDSKFAVHGDVSTPRNILHFSANSSKLPTCYTSIECLDQLVSSSQIIDRWNSDRQSLVQSLDPSSHKSGTASETNKLDVKEQFAGPDLKGYSDDLSPKEHDKDPKTALKLGKWEPWSHFLPKDRSCMCKLGWGVKPYSQRQVCAGCHLVTRLVPKNKLPESSMFQIGVGKYRGMILVVRVLQKELNGYIKTYTPSRIATLMLRKLSLMVVCEPTFTSNLSNITYWETVSGVDQYIITSCIIQSLMKTENLPGPPIFRWSYGCGSNTVLIDENPSLGVGTLKEIAQHSNYVEQPRTPMARFTSVTPLSRAVMRGIIYQLVTVLNFLSKYDFVHGEPSLCNLGFENQPCKFTYRGKSITSPITLIIVPSSQSSISVKRNDGTAYRFYNAGKLETTEFKSNSLPIEEMVPFLGFQSGNICTEGDITNTFINPCLPELAQSMVVGYRIGSQNNVFAAYLRHLGIPLFQSSFDLYMFLSALMSESVFYYAVFNDSEILDIWRELWHPQEYNSVMESLAEIRKREGQETPSFTTLLNTLSKFIFRCDALENTWRRLQKLE
jgi:hypothetical protein